MIKNYVDSVINYLIKNYGYNNPFKIEVNRIAIATNLSIDDVDKIIDYLLSNKIIDIDKNNFIIPNNNNNVNNNVNNIAFLNLQGKIKEHISNNNILCKVKCPVLSNIQSKLNYKIIEYYDKLAIADNLKQLLNELLPIFAELKNYKPEKVFENKRKRILLSKAKEILFIMTGNKKLSLKDIM